MPIKAVCPDCQSSYLLADKQAGKSVRCKNCQAVFVVAEGRTKPSNVAAPSNVTARRAARSREEDEELDAPRRGGNRSVEKKSAVPWIVGGMLAGGVLLLLLCGGVGYVFWLNAKSTAVADANQHFPPAEAPPQFFNLPPGNPPVFNPPQIEIPPVEGQPVAEKQANPDNPPSAAKPAAPPAVADDAPRRPAVAANGELTRDRRDLVKRATVFLRVKMADGTQASGSGFFGCKEARNIVLTNAHVVGMLSPESARPLSVEVVVNSGQNDEWKTTARVLGVDRVSDLAVLDIGPPPQNVPAPLTVRSAQELQELDRVYIFGFPLGEQLGKEISVAETKVTSLRKKGGILDLVQVGAGMNPGNSGGPVVDHSGAVVGVAVAGIPGRAINFAIPGDRVEAILNGRISDLTIEQPYYTDNNKVAAPVVMGMIDPRNLIKEVGLEVWTGNKPPDSKKANRPAARTQPASQEGDSPHVYYKLTYRAPEGRAPIVLPELPQGKVYWQQPRWITAKGETRWAAASPMRMSSAPVTRKPASLVLRYKQGAKRLLELTIDNTFKVSSNDEADAFRIRTAATFTETVTNTGSGGTVLKLGYKFGPSRELILPDGRSLPNSTLEQVKSLLPGGINSLIQLDRLGNITLQSHDDRALRQRGQINPKQLAMIKEFHEMVHQGLEAVTAMMPPNGSVKPLDSWKSERALPVDMPGKALSGKLDVDFTYLGTRKRDGREEAVIHMGGRFHIQGDGISGRADGLILVDLSNGQTLIADTTVKLQLKAILEKPGEEPRELRVLDTIRIHMQRKV